jgi:hypothetical protein
MDREILERKFSEIGARVRFGTFDEEELRRRMSTESERIPIRVDVRSDKKGEFFQIDTSEGSDLEIIVPSLERKDRLLLLMILERARAGEKPMRFLCGHDERHYFAAAVPERSGASSVYEAMEALKPETVLEAQAGVKRKYRQKRHKKSKNPVLRQGEWFFVPADISPPELDIIKDEPISRGAGKPHTCEFIYRVGGQTVYVCDAYPEGLTEEEYKKLIEENPKARRSRWATMERDAQVYAKGRVTHPDHATLHLDTWHRVLPNTESQARSMRFLTFLD